MIYGQILLLSLFVILTFWRRDIFLYIITGLALIVFGFEWYDAFKTNSGMAMALVLIATGLYCFILAIGNVLNRKG